MRQATSMGRQGAAIGASYRVSPYPHRQNHISTGPMDSNSIPEPSLQKDEKQYCPSARSREHRLQDSLYYGSAHPLATRSEDPSKTPQFFFNAPEGSPKALFMQARCHLGPPNQHPIDWNPDMSPSSAPYANSQHTFPAAHAMSPAEGDANSYATGKQKGRKQSTSQTSRRPTVQDFETLVHDPYNNLHILILYVGTDSKYTLASNHAALMVRSVARSPDLTRRLEEATGCLAMIERLVEFVHSQDHLKPEQRGCLALRVCFSSLTALMGDFSSGEIPASDPNVPIVTRASLGSFRQYYPSVSQVVEKLVDKLAKSINMYRHRRSPSASVVTKFQGMLRTLETWNNALLDGTFHEPTNIIQSWLNNHPTQVDGSRQRAPSAQSSPNTPESIPSPNQQSYDTALLSQYSYPDTINQSRRPSHGNTRGVAIPTSMANPGLPPAAYDSSSLFAGPNYLGTTFFPAGQYPSSVTDMHGGFTGLESMYDDYGPSSSGQAPYHGQMHSCR